MPKTPTYITQLVQPRGDSRQARRVWSIDLESVWLPFFTATNVEGATEIPAEELGAPIRLRRDRNTNEVRMSQNGRPQTMVAPKLNEAITDVRDNFTASLVSYAGGVMKAQPDAYKGMVAKSQKAGNPILVREAQDAQAAIAAYEAEQQAKAVAEAQSIVTQESHEEQELPVAA